MINIIIKVWPFIPNIILLLNDCSIEMYEYRRAYIKKNVWTPVVKGF